MAEIVLNIERWGNSLGVRLPALSRGRRACAPTSRYASPSRGGRVVIIPVPDRKPALEERLARFDPKRHGGEIMATKAVGAEHL